MTSVDRPTLKVVLLFAAIALLYTGAGFSPGRVLVPLDLQLDYDAWKPNPALRVPADNRLLSDVLLEYYAWDVVIREHVSSGRVPWRNPYTNGESHLFANPETSLFFPLAWLRFLFGAHGWAPSVFLRLLIAGLTMYWLARTLGAPRAASVLSGLVYLSCGFSILWSMHTPANVVAVLPAFAASLWRLLHRPDRMNAILVILFAGLVTAGGHPETVMHGVVGVAGWLAWQFFRGPSRKVRSGVLAIAASALGFLMLSVQLVPFFWALSEGTFASTRLQTPPGPMRPVAIAGMILPGFLGTPLRGEIDLSALLPMSENMIERSSGFVGIMTLVVLTLGWKGLDSLFKRGLILGIIGLLIAWRLPLLRDAVRYVPLFTLAANERFTLLFAFFASLASGPALYIVAARAKQKKAGVLLITCGTLLLTAGLIPALPLMEGPLKSVARHGIGYLQQRGHFTRPPEVYEARLAGYLQSSKVMTVRRFAVPGLFLIVGGAAFLASGARPRRILLTTSIMGELLSFGLGFQPVVRLEEVAEIPPAIRDLKAMDPATQWRMITTLEVLPPNLGSVYSVADLRAYDVLEHRSSVQRLRQTGYDVVSGALRPESLPLLADAGVRFVLSRYPVAELPRVGGLESPGVGLYEIPGAVHRPKPRNSPPAGLALGFTISVFAAIAAALLVLSLKLSKTHE